MPNTPAELDLIERLLTAYNAIDAHLQNWSHHDGPTSFRSLVDLYAKKNRAWKDAELLRTVAGLRNLLVHEKVEPYEYPCVPTLELVEDLEKARDRLLYPARADRFARKVVTVQSDDSLAHVLKMIHELKITHFPVYDSSREYSQGERRFAGVLTENGITRWLAEHTARDESLIEFRDEPVREVLAREESAKGTRKNYEFAPRRARVEELVQRFHDNTYLEAVLITENSYANEDLLGIVTRWDVLNLEA
jgi:CBS domain-containing protein